LYGQDGQDGQQADEDDSERNHISVFVGATTETGDDSETSFTLGADYERRLSEFFGIGALADFALGKTKRTALLGVPFFVHPTEPLEFHAAPAIEFANEPSDGDTGEDSGDSDSETGSTTNFAVRLGAGYEFALGRFSIAPEVNIDFVSGESASVVYGLAFGIGF